LDACKDEKQRYTQLKSKLEQEKQEFLQREADEVEKAGVDADDVVNS
jgi:hypothetical protein